MAIHWLPHMHHPMGPRGFPNHVHPFLQDPCPSQNAIYQSWCRGLGHTFPLTVSPSKSLQLIYLEGAMLASTCIVWTSLRIMAIELTGSFTTYTCIRHEICFITWFSFCCPTYLYWCLLVIYVVHTVQEVGFSKHIYIIKKIHHLSMSFQRWPQPNYVTIKLLQSCTFPCIFWLSHVSCDHSSTSLSLLSPLSDLSETLFSSDCVLRPSHTSDTISGYHFILSPFFWALPLLFHLCTWHSPTGP